ncbi:hypothetical protein [Halorhabdus amylolytica]|uniref:hypothetical protein n=1 Tax=Halorhabdus amylolytica TaxID=2559573 RepID=UPI0010AAE3F8|nr:hypothetical protein [Halorhabdus amylolytica]
MTETNGRIWLVVGLAVLAFLIVLPAVSAHGNGPVLDNGTVPHGAYQDIDEQIAWMAEHTTAHGRVNATEWTDGRATSMATPSGMADGHHPDHDIDRGHHNDAGHARNGHNQHETSHDNVEESDDEHRNDDGERDHGGMYGGGHGC